MNGGFVLTPDIQTYYIVHGGEWMHVKTKYKVAVCNPFCVAAVVQKLGVIAVFI